MTGGTIVAMTETAPREAPAADRPAEPAATDGLPDLAELVGDWLDWSQCAALLGVPASRVGILVKEHHLASAVLTPGSGPGTGPRIPAAFLRHGEIVKGVSGIITVLHDGGYGDREIIRWLFTEDDTIPGRPIDAIRENRGSEVKRRAQAMAF